MILKPPRGSVINKAHPLAKGLVGCWLFNEGTGTIARDSSGYGNHGTLVNMAAPGTLTSGWGVDGLAFDGSNDYVDIGNIGNVNSIIYQIKPTTQSNGGFVFNTTQSIKDNATPIGWTNPIIYIDNSVKSISLGGDNISNSTFDSNVLGWTANVPARSPISWANDTSGDGSTGYLRFSFPADGNYDRFRENSSIISPSTSYRISFWYRTSASVTGNISVLFTSNFTTLANSVYGASLPPTGNVWKFVSFVTTATSSSYPIFCVMRSGNIGAGSADFDAISVKTVSPAYLIIDTNLHHVAIVDSNNLSASTMKIGNNEFVYFNGCILSVSIYNRALSPEEIAYLYKDPYCMFEKLRSPLSASAIMSYIRNIIHHMRQQRMS